MPYQMMRLLGPSNLLKQSDAFGAGRVPRSTTSNLSSSQDNTISNVRRHLAARGDLKPGLHQVHDGSHGDVIVQEIRSRHSINARNLS